MRKLILALLLPLVALAGQPKAAIQTGKLLDFSEENYKAGIFALEGCVNRDYTIDAGDLILVARHQTCRPGRDPALKVIIGRDMRYVLDERRRDGIGILNEKGKPQWYRLFKVIDKTKSAER